MSLMVCGGCRSDFGDKPGTDPLDDPWIDAIETGDEEPVVAAAPEAPPSADASVGDPISAISQDQGLALAEASPVPEARATAAVVATSPSLRGEPKPATASAHEGGEPVAAPEQPAAESPAVEGRPSEPAPVVEPAPSPSVEPASPPPITSADFDGSYRYVGGGSQREKLEAAIESTVSQLPRAIQGIARRRLTQANPVDASLELDIAGDKITTTFASGFDVTCVIDGAAVHTTGNDGEKLDVRVRSKGSKLVQVMQGKDGARTIVYVLSADRETLTVHHKITADRLPEPLTYRLSYSRK